MSPATTREVAPADFRAGMKQLASAVSVIATGSEADPAAWRGMTATAVCSLCAEPPSLVVCLNQQTGTYRQLRENGLFSVNVLADRDVHLAQTFAGQHGLAGADRFTTGDWAPGRLGVPVLGSALAAFECRVVQTVEYGTHCLLIGNIETIHQPTIHQLTVNPPDEDGRTEQPLVYHSQGFHGLGSEIVTTGGPRR
ncbi:flavin reductase family protein [Streptomyces sp. NBC_00536]|uniref:flavin reductase family protein n=1 Tax=Streptomyces sp. NBC_00536 TaxID=2975769 RepID=UPI002E817830|nr:flavin reductase family protein [Streptomyces sp. NBC_00536]WUC79607.1 flavin reductase family protein [Streptomyces sp. NBC_00536]